jgi:hypothetical protein
MLPIYARAAPRLILFTLVLVLGVAYPVAVVSALFLAHGRTTAI